MASNHRGCLREICEDLLEALGPSTKRQSKSSFQSRELSTNSTGNRTSTGVSEGLLRECLDELLCSIKSGSMVPRESSDRIEGILRGLQALADEQINSIDFHLVPTRWLALYTDVSLVRALRRLWFIEATDKSMLHSVAGSEAVRMLDMALIIAGGCGEGRLRWIHQTIHLAQGFISAPPPIKHEEALHGDRLTKRRRVEIRVDPNPSILFAPKLVPVLPRPPTVSTYTTRHSESPFVIRGFTTSGLGCPPWSAVSTWSDPAYIMSSVGEGRHVPVEIGSAYSDRDWGQRIVRLRDFLTRAGFFGSRDRGRDDKSNEPPMYLAQHSLFRQFPQLESDITLPDYVWSAPSPPADYPTYVPPTNREGVITNVWIGSGSGSIVSPAHTVRMGSTDAMRKATDQE